MKNKWLMGQSLAEKNKHVNQWKWKSQSLGWLFFVNMGLFDVGVEWYGGSNPPETSP